LACTKPAVIKPAKTKEAVKKLGSTAAGVMLFIKTPR
jgi:hypothetical protein